MAMEQIPSVEGMEIYINFFDTTKCMKDSVNIILIRELIIILIILTLTVGLVNLHHQLLGNVHYILLRYLQENRLFRIQLNISKMATLGTKEKSGYCKEVAIVERF